MATLTDEQKAVVEAAKAGSHLKVVAFAGAGKTFTLVEVAKALAGKRILYLTFSKALAEEAKEKFGNLADAMTNHALAYQKTGKLVCMRKNRLREQSLPGPPACWLRTCPASIDLREWGFRDREEALFPVLETVNRFTQSEAETVTAEHIPEILRLEIEAAGKRFDEFADCLVPLAQRAWELLVRYRGQLSGQPRCLPQALPALPPPATLRRDPL
jgi:hypothetical protein